MNTWTSRRSIFALASVVLLAGCEEGVNGFSLLQGERPATAEDKAPPNLALRNAQMMFGAITLVPPPGFCIDKRSLRQGFAVMARCDTLGGRGGAQDAPLGVITASVVDLSGSADLPALLAGSVGAGVTILDSRSDPDLALLYVDADAPAGAARRQWRGLAQIGNALIKLRAFGPEDSPVTKARGGRMLATLVQRTQDASIAADVARKSPQQNNSPKKGLGSLLSDLFE